MNNTTILQKKYKNLYLQVSNTEIQYCIKDTLRNKIEVLNYFTIDNLMLPSFSENNLKDSFKKIDELQFEFDEIVVLHQNNWVTFVPEALFDPNFLGSYLQYTTAVFETDYFTHDFLENYEMHCVYMPFVNINNFIVDKYGSFPFKHSATILVKKILDFSKNMEFPQLFISINQTNFKVIVVKNQKLLFYNVFEYKTETDFIYHVLFTLEQLEINPETIQTNLLGNLNKESDLYKITYKYIRNVNLYSDNNNLEAGISQADYLKYFNLIHLCE